MENNKNLLTKLATSLKVKFKNSKVVKKIAALAMAGCIALAPFAIGCNNTNNNGGNTPGGSGGNNTPTSQYSQLLQNVLDDEYYNTLISQLYTWHDTGYFDPHPYGFLEDEGYNVNLIKSNNLLCNTHAYVLDSEPNNLYMAVNVETKSAQPYFTEYLLKYSLTEKEMNDYNMLHSEDILQAVFMNDEISKLKTPEIISKTKCTVEAHEGLKVSLKSCFNSAECMNGNDVYGILFKDYNISEKRFYVYIYSNNQNKMTSRQAIALIPMAQGTKEIEITSDGAFSAPFKIGQFGFHNNDRITFKETVTNYNTQNRYLTQTDIEFNRK